MDSKNRNRWKRTGIWMVLFSWCIIILGLKSNVVGAVLPGYYGPGGSSPTSAPALNALPVVRNILQGASLEKMSDTKLVVHQNQEKALIDWETFDIGASAWVHFDQRKNTDWTALNRIYDHNPSQIFGRLTGDGRVYLVNQNGILFGPGSRVNVHSLVGSALNLSDENFAAGNLEFQNLANLSSPGEPVPEDACVSNHGFIETDEGGWVFLLGPQVENNGTITTPYGQVGLVAGKHVKIGFAQDEGLRTDRISRIVNVVEGGGSAVNYEEGGLYADEGMAGMYGSFVNQRGVIRSVSAVLRNGNIELVASDKVVLGEESYTGCPITSSEATVHESAAEDYRAPVVDIRGSNPESMVDFMQPTRRIEVYGTVEAPGGSVNLQASERIYLEEDSVVSVSGSVVHLPASSALIEAQLNSKELRDDYGQKGGILQGEYVTFHSAKGSAIGDLSGYLSAEQQTAGEFSVTGGLINMRCETGDIVLKNGATLDFSGGGIWYESGFLDTTKLVCGHRMYDISDAPQWLVYERMMGDYKKVYDRYGIVESYSGIPYGGPGSFQEYSDRYFEGADAGTLHLAGRQIVLDSRLDGSATAGMYQTRTSEDKDDKGNQATTGTVVPKGGRLILGLEVTDTTYKTQGGNDKALSDLVIAASVAPLSGLTADSEIPLPEGRLTLTYASGDTVPLSVIGADRLNAAGLDEIDLYSNTRLVIDEDAEIRLAEGGTLLAYSRQINVAGKVTIPSGTVGLWAAESNTAAKTIQVSIGGDFDETIYDEVDNDRYVELNDGFDLGAASVIDVSGVQIDNTTVGLGANQKFQTGMLNGGSILLEDQTDANFDNNAIGLVLSQGAILDVSGGYRIDSDGSVTGGDAGNVTLNAANMQLDGDIRAVSLRGSEGGALALMARKLTIAAEGADNGIVDGMVLTESRFADTGFTRMTFESFEDLTVRKEIVLAPSLVKRVDPLPAGGSLAVENQSGSKTDQAHEAEADALITLGADYIGNTAIFLGTGAMIKGVVEYADQTPLPESAKLVIEEGAKIQVAPNGSITLKAGGGDEVQMAGFLEAPAGRISVSGSDVTVLPSGRIMAPGYNRPHTSPFMEGLPLGYTPLDGGDVSLSANNLKAVSGAVIDVSGTSPVRQWYLDEDGGIGVREIAGEAGGISLSFSDDLDVQPGVAMLAAGKMDGIGGGSLTLENRHKTRALILTDNPAGISEEETGTVVAFDQLLTDAAGFDQLTLKSNSSIRFQDSQTIGLDRSLTLDTPVFTADGNADVVLISPWITLTNTQHHADPTIGDGLAEGGATFTATANWIDVNGSVKFDGFGSTTATGVTLNANRDIRLSDRFYSKSTSGDYNNFSGELMTPGALVMNAGRIYPTTQSAFTIQTDGIFRTEPSHTLAHGDVASAAGRLTILADSIDHRGVLLAPMGEIILAESVDNGVSGETLAPADRIYLAPHSVLSTRGETLVQYGKFDSEGISWFYADKDSGQQSEQTELTAMPANGIYMTANEVIQQGEAGIDVSGGGDIFTYLFQPGLSGTKNPLTKSNVTVILPDNRIQGHGESIYLAGVEGLAEGSYTVLSDEYAFYPDAVVLYDMGVSSSSQAGRVTDSGYPLTTGRAIIEGTPVASPVVHDFAVRPAVDVLNEGTFNTAFMTSRDAGDISIQGKTTIINGVISGKPLPADRVAGFSAGEGGRLFLSGENVIIGGDNDTQVLFGFDDAVPAGLENQLAVAAEAFSESLLGAVYIGDSSTKTITVDAGSVLSAGNVTLTATDAITLAPGVELHAVDEKGAIALITDGTVTVQENSLLHAAETVTIDAAGLNAQGILQMDGSSLTFASDTITLAPEKSTVSSDDLVLTASDWERIMGADNITLDSRSDLIFAGDVRLTVAETLHIDAARLVGGQAGQVELEAGTVVLTNNDAAVAAGGTTGGGELLLSASDSLIVGNGDIAMDGFSDLHLKSGGEMIFRGDGSLTTGDTGLNLTAARISTAAYQGISGTFSQDMNAAMPELALFEPADFFVDAGTGDLTVTSPDSGPQPTAEPIQAGVVGGTLKFAGSAVTVDTTVDLPAGRFAVEAGSGGIQLGSRAFVSVNGTGTLPGGVVTLVGRDGGRVKLAANSLVDVSAGGQGDAGEVGITAPGGHVMEGMVIATGSGGRFDLDTDRISDFSVIAAATADFDERITVRARSGDLTIASDISASDVKVTADNGNLRLESTLDASGVDGGQVTLNAGNDLQLAAGSRIDAGGYGDDGAGGTVFLNSRSGYVRFEEGAEMHLNGSRQDGNVVFRAVRNGSGIQMDLNGSIHGAADVIAESVAVYDNVEAINQASVNLWQSETTDYLEQADLDNTRGTLLNGLTLVDGNDATRFLLVPGIEIRSPLDGSMELEDAWNLTNWAGTGLPGALTLRSSGNLTLSNELTDSPTAKVDLPGDPGQDAWTLRLIAGADTESADLMAVIDGTGDLEIAEADGNRVYTESGEIWFASGNDTTINPYSAYYVISSFPSTPQLTLGTFDGSIYGAVDGDLILEGGTIQSGTGDINLVVGGDCLLNSVWVSGNQLKGTVRTTGRMPDSGIADFYAYHDGGNISLDVEGAVKGTISNHAWDTIIMKASVTEWSADYNGWNATQGIATMGGGDLSIRTGESFTGQAGTFGPGDLEIYSGGDLDGRFLVSSGSGRLASGGSFGTLASLSDQTVAMMDSQVSLDAQGNILLGTVMNPTLTTIKNQYESWNLTYACEGWAGAAENSAISINAHGGDVVLTGTAMFLDQLAPIASVLPPEVSIEAQGNIFLRNEAQFILAPSPTSALSLKAGESVDAEWLQKTSLGQGSFKGKEKHAEFIMPDVDLSLVYGYRRLDASESVFDVRDRMLQNNYFYVGDTYLHGGDPDPVVISAGEDITGLKLRLAKKVEISAGQDIVDLYYKGQNVNTADVSLISAGGAIRYSSLDLESGQGGTTETSTKGISQGGPGFMLVSAGDSIDLGTSRGIQAIGNLENPVLPSDGCDVTVVAGYDLNKTEEEIRTFFTSLKAAGIDYSEKLAAGELAAAEQVVQDARSELINPFFGNGDTGAENTTSGREAMAGETVGGLNMVRSQIASLGDDSDLFLVSRGDLNVGMSVFGQEGYTENTGVYTAAGGDIFTYAEGDINVNESRMMTFYGGNITAWSDYGNINAGRGDKTQVSVSPASVAKIGDEWVVEFKPPSVGSGIRAMTYDPDGSGPGTAPEPGEVALNAPAGEIDAGEAGIAGGRVILGAQTVVNVQNISFSQGAVGVPTTSEATATVGALTGGGGLSEASKLADASAAIEAANKQFEQDAKAMEKSFMPTWLRVEFMGFDVEDKGWSEDDDNE